MKRLKKFVNLFILPKSNQRIRSVLKREEKGVETLNNREHQNVKEDVNGFLLLMLPMHLIFDILAKLPICTLLICKQVCNTLKNIVSDPYFAQLHQASLDDCCLVIQEVNNPSKIFLTPLIDLDKHALDFEIKKKNKKKTKKNKKNSEINDHCNGKYLSWQTLTMPTLIPETDSYSSDQAANLIGSCNGLLCLQYYANNVTYFYVCNPILGEFTVLPQLKEFQWDHGGFGFCPKSKQYKVLKFISKFKYFDILTLGKDDEWRRISDSPLLPARFANFDPFYYGNLHWIVGASWSENSICSFNLETEKYSYISLPSCFKNTNLYRRFYDLEIGTLDGSFCISSIIHPGLFEVYVMEDYKVKDSWIKKVSICTGYNFGSKNDTAFVTFLDNGVLVIDRSTHTVYYDTRKGTTSDIFVEGYYCATVHIPSFMSLKDIVRRENVEQVERRMLPIFSSKATKR